MKYLTKLLGTSSLIAFLLLCSSSTLLADHVIGGTIGWECVGKDSFKMELTVYRDCNGSSLSSLRLGISTNCGTKNLNLSVTSTKDVTPVCDEQCTRCDSKGCTFKYGMQRVKASAILDVSTYRSNGCCELIAAFSQCCRGGFSSANFHISSRMNLCQSPCDNSPVFQNDPLSLICLGRDIIYSQQAIDADRDSLEYELVPAQASATNNISYSSPYAYDKPLYFLGFPKNTTAFPRGFHFDTEKGELLFRPMKEEQSIIAIDVHSFRNGKRISTVRRDMIIITMKCPDNSPPVLSGVNCSTPLATNFNLEACPGEEVCFKICTSDKDKDDTVSIAWSGGVPGATFTVNNKGDKRESATFCWTPQAAHVSTIPYRFTVNAVDNACPANGKTSRTFSILVKAPAPEVTLSNVIGSCGALELQARQVSSGPTISNYTWLLDGDKVKNPGGAGDTLFHTTTASGNFKYELEVAGVNGCTKTYTDSLVVPDHVTLLTTDTVVCAGDSFNLKVQAKNPQGKYLIHGKYIDTVYNQSAVIKGIMDRKDSSITVTVNDGSCQYRRDIFVEANEAPKFSLTKDGRLCEETAILLHANTIIDSTDSDSLYQYRWYLNTDTNTLNRDTMLLVSKPNTYLLEVTDSMGCSTRDSLRTYIDSSWVPRDTSTCIGNQVSIKLANSSPSPTYYWNDDPKDIDQVSFNGRKRTLNLSKDRYYYIRRVYNYRGGFCTTYDSFKVEVHPLSLVTLSTKSITACPKQETVVLEGSPANGSWTGPGISPTITKVNLDIRTVGSGVYKYVYQYVDTNQCVGEDTAVLNMRPSPVAGFNSSDTVVAIGDSVTFINTSKPQQHTKTFWTIGAPPIATKTGDTATVTFNTEGSYPVALIVLDTLSNCADTLIRSNEVRVYNGIATIGKSQVRLYPNPAINQVWIELSNEAPKGTLSVFDAAGKLVAQQTIRTNKAQLNIESLSEGVYYWNLMIDGDMAVGKLVIQRP